MQIKILHRQVNMLIKHFYTSITLLFQIVAPQNIAAYNALNHVASNVVTISKTMKPVGNQKSYRPISLLCVPYKILVGLINASVKTIIDRLLPKERARFRRRKSNVDQAALLTQNPEDSFEPKKTSAVFVNLTAAYDTVWHSGLICKLLRLLPDNHMVRMIMELVRNQSFTLTTNDIKQNRPRFLKKGVLWGSILASLLFDIYTYDLSSRISRKFGYAAI